MGSGENVAEARGSPFHSMLISVVLHHRRRVRVTPDSSGHHDDFSCTHRRKGSRREKLRRPLCKPFIPRSNITGIMQFIPNSLFLSMDHRHSRAFWVAARDGRVKVGEDDNDNGDFLTRLLR